MASRVYRELSEQEIERLQSQGCRASNWQGVKVVDGIDITRVVNVAFAGEVLLGLNDSSICTSYNVELECGICNASLFNVEVGDYCYISNISGSISNYIIEDRVSISSCGSIECSMNSSFGNGVEVAVINEAGGREVTLFEGLTSQIAYVMALYRHRAKTIAALKEFIQQKVYALRGTKGVIGRMASISGCKTIRDVNIGSHAEVSDLSRVENGTILSSELSPTYVGTDVKAYNFIFGYGATVGNGAMLNRVFVGEACSVEWGFTAVDSLFFANSDVANGEACSLFAAPYTVSHHKSSLLIAGLFSFFNAGSGTNQSNHLFKMGAVHGGIHERGCKFASNGYVALPSREGAFTVVLGRHYNHHDTQDFPFSYLVEKEKDSLLIPAINLRSFGTKRDVEKWGKRDKRKEFFSDLVNFEQYNPYLGGKIFKALELSTSMLHEDREFFKYNGVTINSSALERGKELYLLAFQATIATILSSDIKKAKKCSSKWGDIGGMYAPMDVINALLDDVDKGSVNSIEQLIERFTEIHTSYKNYAYFWAVEALASYYQCDAELLNLSQIRNEWIGAIDTLDNMRKEDSKKDISESMMVGFGIDAQSDEDILSDFSHVRLS